MKYANVKDDLLNLFNDTSKELPNRVYQTKDSDFIIYRGFKITKYLETGYIEILNVRSSDFYRFINYKLLKRFIRNGFEKTCDDLQVIRDNRRVTLISKRIRTCIEDNNVEKWHELRRERRIIVKRIINIRNKWK